MVATRRPSIPVIWRAHDVLGVGHALPKTAGYSRYLCNRMPVAERFAWPVKSRCVWCAAALAKLEEVATAAS